MGLWGLWGLWGVWGLWGLWARSFGGCGGGGVYWLFLPPHLQTSEAQAIVRRAPRRA